MFGQTGDIIGQILGILAVISGFICFQMKSAGKLLLVEMITASIFTAHYFFIGAYTAVALNLLGIIKCVGYYFRDKKGSKNLFLPIFFTAITVVAGILTWEGWHSALILVGLVVYTMSLSLPNPQIIRYSIFIKSPLCLGYNVIVNSIGGIVYECAIFISAIIATIKYHVQKR